MQVVDSMCSFRSDSFYSIDSSYSYLAHRLNCLVAVFLQGNSARDHRPLFLWRIVGHFASSGWSCCAHVLSVSAVPWESMALEASIYPRPPRAEFSIIAAWHLS